MRPYWFSLLLNLLFNLMTIFFSLFSFALLVPLLNLLFQTEVVEVVAKPEFALTSDYLMSYLNYVMSSIIVENGHRYALIFICVVMLVSFLFRNIGRFFAYYTMAKVRVGTIKDLRQDLYDKILVLPLSFYSKQRKGDVMSRITNDVQEVEASILNWIESLIKDPLTILFYFAFLLTQSAKLTLFVLILLPIAGLVIGRIGKILKKESKETQNRLAGITATIEESISGLRIIKGFNAIGYLQRKFGEQNKEYSRSLLGVHRKRDMRSPMSEFLSAIVVIIVLWFGGNMILGGTSSLSAAGFISYIIVFSQIISPIKSFAQAYFNIKKGVASADRIFEFMDEDEVITEKPDALEIKDFNHEIEYQNVSFHYEKDDVLKEICLKIPKGKVIALVGSASRKP